MVINFFIFDLLWFLKDFYYWLQLSMSYVLNANILTTAVHSNVQISICCLWLNKNINVVFYLLFLMLFELLNEINCIIWIKHYKLYFEYFLVHYTEITYFFSFKNWHFLCYKYKHYQTILGFSLLWHLISVTYKINTTCII